MKTKTLLLIFFTTLIQNLSAGIIPDGNIVDTNGLTLGHGSLPKDEKVDTSKWNKAITENGSEKYTYKGNSKNDFLVVEVVRDSNTKRIIGAKIDQKGSETDERFKGNTREVIEYRTLDGVIQIDKDFSASEGKEHVIKNIVTENICADFVKPSIDNLQKCVAEAYNKIPMGSWAEMGTEEVAKIFPEVKNNKEDLKKQYKGMFNKSLTDMHFLLPKMMDMCKQFNDYKKQTFMGHIRKTLRESEDGTSKTAVQK